jgi:hypothetical protein
MNANMNVKPIRRTKWFWGWQDDKEEAWLQDMARQGLHLKSPGFGSYEFTPGEPREMVYRLDFLHDTKNRTSYLQLFQDAGWEHVGELNGWQYWRKSRLGPESDEIFTDTESKIQKYKRLMNYVLVTLPIYVPMYVVVINHKSGIVETIVLGIMLLLIAVYTFMIMKLQQRINQLKAQAGQS